MNARSLKSPFGGMTQWLYQRFTALFMTTYMISLALILTTYRPLTFDVWASLFDHWAIKYTTLVFFILMFFHAWIGILHITEDYIKVIAVRTTINAFLFITMVIELIYLTYFLIGYSYD